MANVVTRQRRNVPAAESAPRRRAASSRVRFWLLLALVALIGLGWLAVPFALWSYNVERAGRLMDVVLFWPEPRSVNSLPDVRSEPALDRALGHLSAAGRWRPAHPYALRLAAQIYAGRKDWLRAADAVEQARSLAPRDPLLAWESALVYEQMVSEVDAAPGENILPDLASVPIDAPAEAIDTTFCRDSRPETCYVGLATFTQPYADAEDGPDVTADVLFMHPPASVRLSHRIEAPLLQFLIGLDPGVREWQTDGATFQVEVEPSTGPAVRVFERTIDRATARKGWVPAWVDLSPWVGQIITLTFRTTGGPTGDTTDDWYGWGNVRLTPRAALSYTARVPQARMYQAWRAAGVDPAHFRGQAHESFVLRNFAGAASWYARDWRTNSNQPLEAAYEWAIAGLISGDPMPQGATQVTPIVYPLSDRVRIEAEDLQFLSTGEPLSNYPGSDPQVGVFWGYSVATAMVQSPSRATYSLTIRAQHTPPAPILLQVEHNFAPITLLDLSREDMRWEEFTIDVTLDRGTHALGLRFLNDFEAPGVSRNAVVDWIELSPKP